MSNLSTKELIRYARHFNLREVGVRGQETLKNSKVLLVGVGGLGSPLALYLAAAGVGRIGLVDFDVVDESNLQRQILHDSTFVDRPKLESAYERLSKLNPHIQIDLHPSKLTSENAKEIVKDYQVVADGGDNFPTRYLVNDTCFFLQKPLASGAIMGFEGQVSVFNYKDSACYRCLFPSPPPAGSTPNCAENGVLGILPGVIGSLQATEVLKILLGIGTVISNQLLLYNALEMDFTKLKIGKQKNCQLCGENPSISDLIDYQHFCGVEGGPQKDETITALELKKNNQVQLIDVREDYEREICAITPSLHIPLSKIESRIDEVDLKKKTVFYCKSGKRSFQALEKLKSFGLKEGLNLEGGILAWIEQVDPSLKKY